MFSVCIYVAIFEQMYSIRSLPTVSYRVKREGDGVEDMTQMEYVSINIHMQM